MKLKYVEAEIMDQKAESQIQRVELWVLVTKSQVNYDLARIHREWQLMGLIGYLCAVIFISLYISWQGNSIVK